MTTFAEKYIARMKTRLKTVRADIEMQRELFDSALALTRPEFATTSDQWRLIAQRASELAKLTDYENATTRNLEDARDDIETES